MTSLSDYAIRCDTYQQLQELAELAKKNGHKATLSRPAFNKGANLFCFYIDEFSNYMHPDRTKTEIHYLEFIKIVNK